MHEEVSTQTLLRRWDMRWTCLKSVTFSVTLGMASLGGMAAEVNQNALDFTLKAVQVKTCGLLNRLAR